MRAEDISAPRRILHAAGREFPAIFSNDAARESEFVYDACYGHSAGYLTIVSHLSARRYGAIAAVAYGAITAAQRAAGQPIMSYGVFERLFDYSTLLANYAAIADGVIAAMPDDTEKKEAGPQAAEATEKCPGRRYGVAARLRAWTRRRSGE